MASSVSPSYFPRCFSTKPQLIRHCRELPSRFPVSGRIVGFGPIKASVESPPFPLFQPPQDQQYPSQPQMESADPDFYKIGYVRSVRAYGIEFKEGPDGYGVYASKDVEPRRRARLIMEIPLELMITIRQKLPWMFFPDIVPIGHPIFDIINSTNPEIGI